MSFFESAKQIEQKGIEHYTKLSENAPDATIKGIFSFLADQERDHYSTFEAIEHNASPAEIKPTQDILARAKEVFSELASTKSIQQPLYDYEAAYRDAYDFEQESIRLYSTALENASNQKEQQQLTRIIDEEKKHALLMDSLCEFVKKPKEWLENAEWHHLDEY